MSLKDEIKSKLAGAPAGNTAVMAAPAGAAGAVANAPPVGVGPQATSAARGPAVNVASLFSGIRGAKASFQSNYLRAGEYVCLIRRIKADVTRKKRAFVAIELTVLVVLDNAEGKGHRGGEECTHMLMADQDAFLPNWKAFVAHTLSCPEDQVTEDACVDLCSDDQPLAGTIVRVSAKTILTKAKQQPFTQVDYKGEVPASEVLEVIDAKVKAVVFPDGRLENMAKIESADAAPQE